MGGSGGNSTLPFRSMPSPPNIMYESRIIDKRLVRLCVLYIRLLNHLRVGWALFNALLDERWLNMVVCSFFCLVFVKILHIGGDYTVVFGCVIDVSDLLLLLQTSPHISFDDKPVTTFKARTTSESTQQSWKEIKTAQNTWSAHTENCCSIS